MANVTAKFKTDLKKADIKSTLEKSFDKVVVKMPLKPGAGRKRGNAWELKFGKDLSLWWTGGEDRYIFKRTLGSGGSASDKSGATGQCGDLVAIKESGFRFANRTTIELKVVKDTRVETAALLAGKSKMFGTFWKQCYEDSLIHHRHPILVVKIDNLDTFIFNTYNDLGTVSIDGHKVNFCTAAQLFARSTDEVVNSLDEWRIPYSSDQVIYSPTR